MAGKVLVEPRKKFTIKNKLSEWAVLATPSSGIPRMTADGFRDLVRHQSNDRLLELCLLEDLTPYVFEPKPAAWDMFRNELASDLGVSQNDIRVVGSGRFGFSTRPDRNLAGFRDRSDIDVVVVNSNTFDELWFSLLHAAYPRGSAAGTLGGWLKKRRSEVYTGWITPLGIHIDHEIFGEKASPVLNLRTRWFNALKKASRHPPRRHEKVNGRLYRTWRHAELYHLNCLAELRKSLFQ